MNTYLAFRTEDTHLGFINTIQTLPLIDPKVGEVRIKVAYSGVNYKDLLSSRGNRAVTQRYPHTPGIDAAGVIEIDPSNRFKPGDEVVVMGYDMGMNRDGGFAQYITVPIDWVLKKPSAFTLKQTMQIGTGGFTAALGISKLILAGQTPSLGPVVVSGATGGVGGYALQMLTRLGFDVWAVSGKTEHTDQLLQLGADRVLKREEVVVSPQKPLLRSRWAGAFDTVGGDMLCALIKQCSKLGSVTTCGNVGGAKLDLTVLPFILNGINLLGINAADTPMSHRKEVWKLLERAADPDLMAQWGQSISLQEVGSALEQIEQGKHTGRFTISI